MKFSLEDVLLCILTTQTQYRCTGDVGIMDISGEEGAQCFRVLPRAAASTLVGEKFYSINIPEHPLFVQDACGLHGVRRYGLGLSVAVEVNKLADEILINIGFAKTECVFKSLLDHSNIPVFTKDERYHKPIVSNAYLAVGAMIAHESFVFPTGNVGCVPIGDPGLFCKRGGRMPHIMYCDDAAGRDRLGCLAYDNAIHPDHVAFADVRFCHFMF